MHLLELLGDVDVVDVRVPFPHQRQDLSPARGLEPAWRQAAAAAMHEPGRPGLFEAPPKSAHLSDAHV